MYLVKSAQKYVSAVSFSKDFGNIFFPNLNKEYLGSGHSINLKKSII